MRMLENRNIFYSSFDDVQHLVPHACAVFRMSFHAVSHLPTSKKKDSALITDRLNLGLKQHVTLIGFAPLISIITLLTPVLT